MTFDQAHPEVTLTLGGKVRTVTFDWWAISLLEEEVGPDFLSGANLSRFSPRNVILLVWAGLCSSTPELEGTSPQARRAGQRIVAKWLSEGALLNEAAGVITAAVTKSMARMTGTEEEQPEKKEPAEPTGSAS